MIYARDWDSDVIRAYADEAEAERDFRLRVRKRFNRILHDDVVGCLLFSKVRPWSRILTYDHTNGFNFGGD